MRLTVSLGFAAKYLSASVIGAWVQRHHLFFDWIRPFLDLPDGYCPES